MALDRVSVVPPADAAPPLGQAASTGPATAGSAPLAREVLTAVDPATRDVLAGVFATAPDRIAAIVARARQAGRVWGDLSFGQRAAALARLRSLVARHAPEIAETIARSMGKPLIEALSVEVSAVLDALDDCIAHAADDLADEPMAMPAQRGRTVLIRRAPHAVVCVIAPVSSPFELAMAPAVGALAAGSAVIVKPASTAPLVGVLIERLFDDAFAETPGLAQVAFGTGALGTQLATADGIDFVAFAGSAPAGRTLRAALAPLQRPARFELATAAALIVCDDANLERAANATVFGRFSNNGCSGGAVHRVYVQRTVADAFIHKVIHKVRALKSGPCTDPFCEIGPLASGDGLEHLRAVLQDALDRRALLVAGGFPAHVTGRDHGERRGADRQGWYWPPTVLTQVDHAMRVMAEPLFGPILPIQRVEDDREAIALANDTDCSFDACVFSADLSRANRIAAQLRAGWVTVNDVPLNMPRLHGSGARPAGVDRDQGGARCRDPRAVGPRQFTVCQTLLIDDGRRDSEAHWFPYSAAKLQAVERTLAARAG